MRRYLFPILLLPVLAFVRPDSVPVDLFYGDSITFGNELNSLQYTDRWTKQFTLASSTAEQNLARSGASMASNPYNRPVFNINDVPGYSPSVRYVFVSYWVNDYLYGKTPAEFAAATSTAVDGIIAKGWAANQIVLCFNYLPESQGTWINMSHATATQWLAALRSVQQAKGTRFLDFYTPIYNRSDKASYAPDLIHPTAAWNATMKDLALTNIEGPPSTLPARFIAFNGSRSAGVNELKWTVASQVNVSHYEVERSSSGQSWTKAGVVSATVSGNDRSTYSFSEKIAGPTKTLYRIATVDRNGARSYSSIIMLQEQNHSKTEISSAFPNPFASNFNVLVQAAGSDRITATISTPGGQLVNTSNHFVEKGTNTISMTIPDLPKGLYLLKVSNSKKETIGVMRLVKE